MKKKLSVNILLIVMSLIFFTCSRYLYPFQNPALELDKRVNDLVSRLTLYAQIPFSQNDTPAHRQMALQAARESIVLLKNKNKVLPLTTDLKTIAVIGPNANRPEVMYGNYNGIPSHAVTPLEGIRVRVGNRTRVLYAQGCNWVSMDPVGEMVKSRFLQTPEGQTGLKFEYFNGHELGE